MSLRVLIPTLSWPLLLPSSHDTHVGDLLNAIWEMMNVPLEAKGADFSRLSLRSLSTPVSLKPWDSIHDRVEDSAHKNGWVVKQANDEVPSGWCDPKNVHVYLYIDQVPVVRAAKKLYKALWGKELKAILHEIFDGGTTWKYVPKEQIDSLELNELGYSEPQGLLVRTEFDDALKMMTFDYNAAMKYGRGGGVIITGQPGTGKSCFLYYLLLRLLSQKTPVALQTSRHILVFGDDGVHRYPLDADPHHLPKGTWALSGSDGNAKLPCTAFLGAITVQNAWIIQTASPPEEMSRGWKRRNRVVKFVMKHFSIEEMTALSKVLGLNATDIRRNYEKWGPSVHTCVWLSRSPSEESAHEDAVKNAAIRFVEDFNGVNEIDAIRVSHILFSVRPSDETRGGRMIPIADMATERIKAIISYTAAVADTYQRGAFFRIVNKHSRFKASAGYMFEKFVLTWLSSDPKAGTLVCTSATGRPDLLVPACEEKRSTYFDNLDALKKMRMDKLPSCFLPRFPSPSATHAIICTDQFIITVQVTVSNTHSAKGSGLADIMSSLPSRIREGRDWCHVFITDKEWKAQSLRGQRLSNLPDDIYIYSGVYDVGERDIISGGLWALDEDNQRVLECMDANDEGGSDYEASGSSCSFRLR